MGDVDDDLIRRVIAEIDDVLGGDVRWGDLADGIRELEELLARSVLAGTRWLDLKRHLRFRDQVDWEDITRSDWPSVRRALLAGTED